MTSSHSEGTILTTSYLGSKLAQSSTPQRRRLLYCQKGFICRCTSCEEKPDLFRRIACTKTSRHGGTNGGGGGGGNDASADDCADDGANGGGGGGGGGGGDGGDGGGGGRGDDGGRGDREGGEQQQQQQSYFVECKGIWYECSTDAASTAGLGGCGACGHRQCEGTFIPRDTHDRTGVCGGLSCCQCDGYDGSDQHVTLKPTTATQTLSTPPKISTADPAIASKLQAEARLAAAATKLFYNYDFAVGRRFDQAETTQLATLYKECKEVLGSKHFATHVVRRVDLAQQAPAVMQRGDQDAIAAWMHAVKECEAYVEECEV